MLATKVREVEAEFQPLHKLYQALETNTGPSINANNEMIYLEDNTTRRKWKTEETSKHDHELTMLVDCGSPSTIVGVENFKQIKQQYTPMIQSGFEYRQSNKHYEFGGGRKTYSLGKVRLPIYVIDKNRNPHLLHVWVEVLNQPKLPFLLGSKSLTRVKGTLCFGEHTLTINWGNKRLCLPINQERSGHFHLQFYPMAQAEENYLIRETVHRENGPKRKHGG